MDMDGSRDTFSLHSTDHEMVDVAAISSELVSTPLEVSFPSGVPEEPDGNDDQEQPPFHIHDSQQETSKPPKSIIAATPDRQAPSIGKKSE
jgi:hypothetical protein